MMWILLLLFLTVSFLLGQRQEDDIRQQSEKKSEIFRSEGESKNVRQGNVRDGVEMRGLDG